MSSLQEPAPHGLQGHAPARQTSAESLSRSGSAFLDCIRFGTALVVFLGHVPFVPALAALVHVAHIAVCLFFVLSGFVIRMVVQTRETTRREFLIDRASRIYSVVLPALLFTYICVFAAKSIEPSFALDSRWSDVPMQLVANLTFMAENWGRDITPMNNSVFWSLSFECVYYVLFALLYSGFRRKHLLASPATWFAVLLMIVAGPAIVLLFPTWLAGVLLYDVYQWLRRQTYGVSASSALLLVTAGVMFASRRAIEAFLLDTQLSQRTAWMQNETAAHFPPLADHLHTAAWLARFSPSFYLAAAIAVVAMLWVLLVLDRFLPDLSPALTRRLRWIADGTFALYLLHLPMLVVIGAVFHNHPPLPVLWLCFVVLVCILLSRSFEHLKLSLRHRLRRLFPERAKTA